MIIHILIQQIVLQTLCSVCLNQLLVHSRFDVQDWKAAKPQLGRSVLFKWFLLEELHLLLLPLLLLLLLHLR